MDEIHVNSIPVSTIYDYHSATHLGRSCGPCWVSRWYIGKAHVTPRPITPNACFRVLVGHANNGPGDIPVASTLSGRATSEAGLSSQPLDDDRTVSISNLFVYARRRNTPVPGPAFFQASRTR